MFPQYQETKDDDRLQMRVSQGSWTVGTIDGAGADGPGRASAVRRIVGAGGDLVEGFYRRGRRWRRGRVACGDLSAETRSNHGHKTVVAVMDADWRRGFSESLVYGITRTLRTMRFNVEQGRKWKSGREKLSDRMKRVPFRLSPGCHRCNLFPRRMRRRVHRRVAQQVPRPFIRARP